MGFFETECGVITDSIVMSQTMVTVLHLWGTAGVVLIQLSGSEHFGAYLQG